MSEHVTTLTHHAFQERATCSCGWVREIPSGWFSGRASRKALRLAEEHERAFSWSQELED